MIANGTSERQLRALTDGVQEATKKGQRRAPRRVEGRSQTGWVLLDYSDVVVHLFSPEQRVYYKLEALWREGKIVLRIQ